MSLRCRLALTTSKSCPGIAKTFSSRAARDIAGGCGASGGDSWACKGSSIQRNQGRLRPNGAHAQNTNTIPGYPVGSMPPVNWLSGMDSNHDKELQRLLCYHYTTGQDGYKLAAQRGWCKGKTPAYLPQAS